MAASQPIPELPFRARRILYAIITEYISTGEPVGSRKLSKRYGLNLSPASIRNVLSDLEEAGFLTQPHTSAGRVPTDLGFRVFVDALMQMREVSAEDRASVLSRLKSLGPGDHGAVVREAGRLLASLTGTAAIVTPPRVNDERLQHVHFMQLRPRELVGVLVTDSGTVQNRHVRLSRDIAPNELTTLNNYLEEVARGRTLVEVRDAVAAQMTNDRGEHDLKAKAREIVEASLPPPEERGEVLIEGQGLLFDRPEFASAEKIRSILRTFEEKRDLLDLLERTISSGGIQVLIGNETHLGDVEDVSVVTANYRRAGANAGMLGIIGPTRLDYAKVVPLVGFTARVMSEVLDGDSEDDDDKE